MIKNIIFDYGNTLVEFEPRNIALRFGVTDEEEIKLICEKLFDRKYWDRLDDGTLPQEEFVENVKNDLPEKLHSVAEKICDDWVVNLPFISGMDSLVKKLKHDGYSLFLLSNISKHFAERSDEIEIFEFFDGLVFSGKIGLVKPSGEIFDFLLGKYSLKPGECLFVDDNRDNIAMAEKKGINALRFEGKAEDIEKFLSCETAKSESER